MRCMTRGRYGRRWRRSLVAERQELRASAAGQAELEENRRRLAAAQSRLSHLLIERHLPQAGAA